jgi:hypothetical protein
MLRRFFGDRSRLIPIGTRLFFAVAYGSSSVGWAADGGSAPASGPSAKTLNIYCRAAKLPHGPLPEERLPVERSLSAADALSGLAAVKAVSGVRKPLCSSNSPPDSALQVIDRISDPLDPISHHKRLPARVADQLRSVHDQVE